MQLQGVAGQSVTGEKVSLKRSGFGQELLELDTFNKTTPAMINAIAVIRAKEIGSLKKIIPMIAVPAAPMPVQTA